MTTHERDRAHSGADHNSEWYKEELEDSAEFRKTYRNRLSVVKPKDNQSAKLRPACAAAMAFGGLPTNVPIPPILAE